MHCNSVITAALCVLLFSSSHQHHTHASERTYVLAHAGPPPIPSTHARLPACLQVYRYCLNLNFRSEYRVYDDIFALLVGGWWMHVLHYYYVYTTMRACATARMCTLLGECALPCACVRYTAAARTLLLRLHFCADVRFCVRVQTTLRMRECMNTCNTTAHSLTRPDRLLTDLPACNLSLHPARGRAAGLSGCAQACAQPLLLLVLRRQQRATVSTVCRMPMFTLCSHVS